MGTNQKISVTFSEPMNSASILAPGTFTVTGPGLTPVPGTVTYDATNNIATFAPIGGTFATGTTFTATITTGGLKAWHFCRWRITTYGRLRLARAQTRPRHW